MQAQTDPQNPDPEDFRPPPAGGHRSYEEPWGAEFPGLDLHSLLALLDTIRQAAPTDLQHRLTALQREALLTLRAVIDWYLDRLDHQPQEAKVESIPID